jgi:LPS-assembly lipoprotein
MMRSLSLCFLLLLAACGLQPLYQGGLTKGPNALLNSVDVPAIEGKAGWLMRDELTKRFGQVRGTPRYRLDVRLDDQITGNGVRRDDSVTRERRTLRARYQLIDLSDNSIILDATSGSDAGIDVVSSEYATVAAENSALERLTEIVADQIVTKVALKARQKREP